MKVEVEKPAEPNVTIVMTVMEAHRIYNDLTPSARTSGTAVRFRNALYSKGIDGYSDDRL